MIGKETLEALHPNIACMRHPDHIGSKGKYNVYFIFNVYNLVLLFRFIYTLFSFLSWFREKNFFNLCIKAGPNTFL